MATIVEIPSAPTPDPSPTASPSPSNDIPRDRSGQRQKSRSRIPGFYRLDLSARHDEIQERFNLDDRELRCLANGDELGLNRADKMVENCVGIFGLPLGLGLNLNLNGKDWPVPMVVEEPSVVAAVSNSCRIVRQSGGFVGDADPGVMIGQVQILGFEDLNAAVRALHVNHDRILEVANSVHPNMKKRGGGAIDTEVRVFTDPQPMIVLHLLIDCCEAMGANAVNAMAEGVAPLVEELTGGRVVLRILSNLADKRRARVHCAIPEKLLATGNFDGAEVAQGIADAYLLAAVDPYRAATHNKGIMNGIDPVAIATGNDWRGIEAGAHAFAARDGRYTSLTRWWREDGHLHGSIDIPMAVGVVGGSTQVHPAIAVVHKIMGHPTAQELATLMAAVGLAQNLGALKALASEGIQRGHMTLHARSVALAAGADSDEVAEIAGAMVRMGTVKVDVAKTLLAERRN